jgi:hypothetical protein
MIASNGFLYLFGGTTGTSQSGVYSAPFNADGTIGSWSAQTSLTTAVSGHSTFVANGYFYHIGGADYFSATTYNTVYIASTPRVVIASNLDLINTDNSGLTEGGGGGSLTAGNTRVVGTFDVSDQANFAQGVSIGGNLTVGGKGTNANPIFAIQNSNGQNLLAADTSNTKITTTGDLVANNVATGVTGSATAVAYVNTNTIYLTAAGSFANGDVIFINNAGQDYFTRITGGGGTTTLTVSPNVDYDASASITKYTVQNIGALTSDYNTLSNRFFQGYFLGGVVTGAGSTTLSDGNLTSTTNMRFSSPSYTFKPTSNSATAFQVQDASGNSLLSVNSITGKTTFSEGQISISGPSTGPTITGITPGSGGGLVPGTYFYKVSAVTDKGELVGSSGQSSTATAASQLSSPPAAPSVSINVSNCTNPNHNRTDYGYTYYTAGGGETTVSPAAAWQTGNYTLQYQRAATVSVPNIVSPNANIAGRKIYVKVFRLSPTLGYGEHWALIGTLPGTGAASFNDSCIGYDSLPDAPASNTAFYGGTQTLNVAWNTVPNASSYRVYRGTSAGTEKFLASSATNSYADIGSATPDSNQSYPTNSTSNRFGIGTPTPLATLDVRGDGLFRSIYDNSSTFQIQNAASVNAVQVSTNNVSVTGIYSGANSDAIIKVAKDSVTNRSISAAGIVSGSAFNTANGDYAEWIEWNGPKPPAGDIVDYKGAKMVVSSVETAAVIANDKFPDGNSILVALTGQVGVRVSGAVNEGDFLLDNGDGSARAVSPATATLSDYVSRVGTALESSAIGGKVLTLIAGPGADATQFSQQANSFADLNISGTLTTNDLVVMGNALFQGNITVNGHIVTGGGTPLATALSAAGTGATVAIDGNDSAGKITITTGSDPATGDIGKIDFSKPFSNDARTNLTPMNGSAAELQYYYSSTNNNFTLKSNNPLAPNTTYIYSYWVVE